VKKIIIQVSCCEHCLNYAQYDKFPDEDIPYCTETGKEIKNIHSIPEWCPLSDME